MKKMTAILLAFCMIVFLSACDSGENNELNSTLNDILTSVSSEFEIFTDNISNTSGAIVENMGDSFDGYKTQKDAVYSLYDEIESGSENLFFKVQSYSIEYFENVANLGIDEYEEWEYAMDEFYKIWSESMEKYHDVCFESANEVYWKCNDLLKSEYYRNKVDSDTYFKETAEMEKEYEEILSVIYDLNLSAWNKTNSDYNIVCNGFFNGISNVDAIFEKESDEPNTYEE